MGRGIQNLSDRWYGPEVAIVTITGFDVDNKLLLSFSEDDQIISANYNRLKNRFPYSKKIKCSDMYDHPISLEDLRGVKTLYIIGHGDHQTGSVGLMDVQEITKLLIGSILQKTAKLNSTEEKREAFRASWQVREINLVSCNSAVSGDEVINIADQLKNKLTVIAKMVGFPIQVRGVNGYATVSDTGQVLRVSRDNYKNWQTDLKKLKSDATEAIKKGTRLSSDELRKRNRQILDRYSSGVNNDFTTYQAQNL